MPNLGSQRQYCSSRSNLQTCEVRKFCLFYLFYLPFIFQFDNCKLLFHLRNHDGHNQIKSASDYFLSFVNVSGHKIMAQNHIFSETTNWWCFILRQKIGKIQVIIVIKFIVNLHLQAFLQKFEKWKNAKIWFLFTETLKNFFSKTTQQIS